jgi:hypothetical protein
VGGNSASIQSHLQPIIEVAKPVIDRAAFLAHWGVSAVIITRDAHILKASAKVSTISVFWIYITLLPKKMPL